MIGHAFEGLSPMAIRVQLFTAGTNLRSQTAIAKLGAVREGTLRHYRIIQVSDPAEPARIADTVCFGILAEEWPSVKQRLEARVISLGKA